MNYFEPEIGIAAAHLARAAAGEVAEAMSIGRADRSAPAPGRPPGPLPVVAPRVCCGRALISKGFLDAARRQAEASVRALYPLAEAGTLILFCEPSCYSAVRDDHPSLLRGDLQQRAQRVADCCVTFEEWAVGALVGPAGGSYADPAEGGSPFRAGPPHLLLHAHCHQRALVGSGPAARLLAAIPECRVTDLDSGCCGMAGSFGYEREHYEVSQRVGEHRLLPAVRDRAPDTLVVASGFSCRQQIRHFTGVEAVHPAVLLRSLLAR